MLLIDHLKTLSTEISSYDNDHSVRYYLPKETKIFLITPRSQNKYQLKGIKIIELIPSGTHF